MPGDDQSSVKPNSEPTSDSSGPLIAKDSSGWNTAKSILTGVGLVAGAIGIGAAVVVAAVPTAAAAVTVGIVAGVVGLVTAVGGAAINFAQGNGWDGVLDLGGGGLSAIGLAVSSPAAAIVMGIIGLVVGIGRIIYDKMVVGAGSVQTDGGTKGTSGGTKNEQKEKALENTPQTDDPNPTKIEAAKMAAAIYDKDVKGTTISGWTCTDVYQSGGLRIGTFEKTLSDGTKAYTIVNKGTTPTDLRNWGNNLTQPFGGSGDMKKSLKFAENFEKSHSGSPITFVGHSKGGAEAAAMAVATDKNCIIFNPASVNLKAYKLNADTYTGDMTAYIVEGEVLNNIFGSISKPIGDVVYLEPPKSTLLGIKEHLMESVLESISKR